MDEHTKGLFAGLAQLAAFNAVFWGGLVWLTGSADAALLVAVAGFVLVVCTSPRN